MARILFLTQVLPYPLYGGAKIRAYYMLRYLSRENEVTLVSFTRADDQPSAVAHLEQFCQAVHTVPIVRSVIKNGQAFLESTLKDQPLVIARDRIPAMEALLQRLVSASPFDIIHADQTSMAYYGLFARDLHPMAAHPFTVLDQHNALYLVVQRQAKYEGNPLKQALWRREAQQLARYEAALLRDYDEILTVTSEDKEALLNLLPQDEAWSRSTHLTVVPICVDLCSQQPLPHQGNSPQIIHLGTMFWPPNAEGVLWFAGEVLPLVLAEVPEARFTIAGKDPPAKVRALASAPSPPANHVKVTGFLADPLPLLAESQVFVVPLMAGGGMRVKILDAWLWGLPVVSTTIGAEGILIEPGVNILIADDAQSFATAVVRLLTDPRLRAELAANGRRWVEKHYEWQSQYRHVNDVYQRAQRVKA